MIITKNISLVLVLFLICFSSGLSQDSPTVDLSGSWDVRLDSQDQVEKNKLYLEPFPNKIFLPGILSEGGYGAAQGKDKAYSGHLVKEYDYVGKAWYKREVELTLESGSDYFLFLERCHWETRVWLNGHYIGSQNSLSVPHIYKLNDFLKKGKNQIVICVDNTIKLKVGSWAHSVTKETQTNWNGIIGRLEIQKMPQTRISDLQIFSDPSHNVVLKGTCAGDFSDISSVNISVSAADDPKTMFLKKGLTLEVDDNGVFELVFQNPGLEKWDEFQPQLYDLQVELLNSNNEPIAYGGDRFGLRTLHCEGNRMLINGERLFVRGNLNGCEFPLTGYPPTKVEDWERIFNICKSHGLNYFRFHSWCPPKAAFEAADRVGFYLHPEAPFWSTLYRNTPEARFMTAEMMDMLSVYANHPSMISLGVGNELKGDPDFMNNLLIELKDIDPSRLYTADMNTPGFAKRQTPLHFDDFFVTRHTKHGSLRLLGQGRFEKNTANDGTDYDLWEKIRIIDMPTLNHELGGWSVHPAFDDLDRYSGNLKPINLDMYREHLVRRGLEPKLKEFSLASGRLSWLFYKEDIETSVRTRDFGGYQILQMHDFPGQGEALVGLLDAFYDSKGFFTPEETHMFCSEVVPLLRLDKLLWLNNETMKAEIQVANYSFRDLKGPVLWQIKKEDGSLYASGALEGKLTKGELNSLGGFEVPLNRFDKAEQVTVVLTVPGTEFKNQWNIWIYPEETLEPDLGKDILILHHWDEQTRRALKAGKTVLLLLDPKTEVDSYQNLLQQDFYPTFWSYTWSSSKHNSSSGILCDPEHPALKEFPTESFSNFQWAQLQNQSLSFVLNGTPSASEPIVYCIDDFHRGFKLGHVLETRAQQGKLLICGFDLVNDLDKRPVARQLRHSLLKYVSSGSFDPGAHFDVDWLFFPRILGSARIQADDADSPVPPQTQKQPTFQEEYAQWRSDSTAVNSVLNLFDNNWATGWETTTSNGAMRVTVELDTERSFEGLIFKPIDRLTLPDEIKIYFGASLENLNEPALVHPIAEQYKYMRQILFEKPKKAKFLVFEFSTREPRTISLAEIEPLFINSPQVK